MKGFAQDYLKYKMRNQRIIETMENSEWRAKQNFSENSPKPPAGMPEPPKPKRYSELEKGASRTAQGMDGTVIPDSWQLKKNEIPKPPPEPPPGVTNTPPPHLTPNNTIPGPVVPPPTPVSPSRLPPKYRHIFTTPPPPVPISLAGMDANHTVFRRDASPRSPFPPSANYVRRPPTEEELENIELYRRKQRKPHKPSHQRRDHSMAFVVSAEEEYHVRQYIAAVGFRSISDFVRKAIFYVIQAGVGPDLAKLS